MLKKERFKKPPIVRFFRKVNTCGRDISKCWEWKGSNNGEKGYGKFWYNGKNIYAHRASYIMHYGKIPQGMVICHSCDNPKCVNPYHLSANTQSKNIKDAVRKGRMFIPKLKGEKNGNSKLTVNIVLKIKKELNDGKTLKEIANNHNTAITNISSIKNKRTWGYVA